MLLHSYNSAVSFHYHLPGQAGLRQPFSRQIQLTIIPYPVHADIWIREAMRAGARLLSACREVGLSLSTWRRWNGQAEDRRPTAVRPVPANKLTA
ncbi:hypothetical protein ACLEDU_17220 [Lonsdalea quercina]|uniref:hypothetical protein n=1 Tax=Lonsdalea quercina TaxID=71657 RepID=UPI00397506E7